MKNSKSETKIKKKPWPTKDAMEQVYEMNLWGGNNIEFYSGMGSHHPEIVQPYIEVLSSFLSSFTPPLVVCDLGCGDFNVGKELVTYTKRYVAVDIVADLIEHTKENFKAENLEFRCLDIAVDDLPAGDCALVRQVLQHVSNAEIHSILNKLAHYKYVILTEHVPVGEFIPNKEIISGQGTRLKKQSGINLIAPPFNLKVLEEKELVVITSTNFEGAIVTMMYRMF